MKILSFQSKNHFHSLAIFSLFALILLCVCWETFLAPYRPGGSFLVLKVIPLLFPVRGVLKGDIYTMQWSSMFILFYFIEGVVRSMGDAEATSRILSILEILFTLTFFLCAILYVKPYKKIAKAHKKALEK